MQESKEMCSEDQPSVTDALSRLTRLPALPAVMSRILATVADPDASALDLGPQISSDQSLAATLLRVVNSAYYGRYRRVASITSAIVMLGFNEVRNLTLATTTFRAFPAGHHNYDRTQLWRHSLATAIAAEHLAKALGIPAEGCFEAGLLHDIGKVVFDVLYPDQFQLAIADAQARTTFLRDTEPAHLGMDHAAVGRLLAEQWDLPPSVVTAIAHHHRNLASKTLPSLPDLVAAANIMTYDAGLGEASNGLQPEPLADGLFGLSAQQWETLANNLANDRPRIDEFLGST